MSDIKELGLFPDENSMKPVRFCSKQDSNGSSWSVDSNEDGVMKRRMSFSSKNLTFELGFLREMGETRKKPRVFEFSLFFWEGELSASLRFSSLRLRERKINAWASLYSSGDWERNIWAFVWRWGPVKSTCGCSLSQTGWWGWPTIFEFGRLEDLDRAFFLLLLLFYVGGGEVSRGWHVVDLYMYTWHSP